MYWSLNSTEHTVTDPAKRSLDDNVQNLEKESLGFARTISSSKSPVLQVFRIATGLSPEKIQREELSR